MVTAAGPRTVLLGCGHMGTALVTRWLEADALAWPLEIVKPSPLPEGLRGQALLRHQAEAAAVAGQPDVVFLAVKPQQLAPLLPALYARWGEAPLYISIAAGVRLAWYQEVTSSRLRVVRAMPNMPVALGQGVMSWVASTALGAADTAHVERLFRPLGHQVALESEAWMDAATALAGSGPAYVYAFARALMQAGVAQGLPAALARTLALATLRGSAAYAEHHPEMDLDALQHAIMSPGGTTEAAMQQLQKNGLWEQRLHEAVAAALTRARALADGDAPSLPASDQQDGAAHNRA